MLGIVDWVVIVAAVEVIVVATVVWLEIALVASEVALAELAVLATVLGEAVDLWLVVLAVVVTQTV